MRLLSALVISVTVIGVVARLFAPARKLPPVTEDPHEPTFKTVWGTDGKPVKVLDK